MKQESLDLIEKSALDLDEIFDANALSDKYSEGRGTIASLAISLSGKVIESVDDDIFSMVLKGIYDAVSPEYHSVLDEALASFLSRDLTGLDKKIVPILVQNCNIMDDEYEEVIFGPLCEMLFGIMRVFVSKNQVQKSTDPTQDPPPEDNDSKG